VVGSHPGLGVMSAARDVILGRIRSALGADLAVPSVVRDYRSTSHLDDQAVIDRFAEVVDDYRASVHRCAADEVGGTVEAIIAAEGARRVAVPDGLPDDWLGRPIGGRVVEVVRDTPTGLSPQELDAVDLVVTGSAVAIAETGTIVLDASEDQGRRALTLVPDHHVCIVPADRIVATVPEALARLDPRRPLTMISGPSATSDIELDRVEGVHGPRTLDVVVVANGGADDLARG
jgi:L-lactate dehydrogenase complex protein LldG